MFHSVECEIATVSEPVALNLTDLKFLWKLEDLLIANSQLGVVFCRV